MTESAAETILDYPAVRTHPFDPPVEYGRLRIERPVSKVRLADGRYSWLVTRFEDARFVYSDARFSSDRRLPGFPVRFQGQAAHDKTPPSMVGLDGAAHAAARGVVMSEFTHRRVEALRPRIQEVVDEFIDTMLAGDRPADLVQALALPVPALVNCLQIGVPYRDRDFFHRLVAHLTTPGLGDEDRVTATVELRNYLADLVAAKEKKPGDDLLSRQIARQREEEGAVDQGALVSLAYLLLIAGYETTAGMIALGVLALLQNPDQLALVRDNPKMVAPAVEELLRYFTPLEHMTCRVATEDVKIGDVLVGAGEGVIIGGPAADRDESVFFDPDRLDIARGTRRHLAFGHGPHQCIGQNVARVELEVVYGTVFRRIPNLQLAIEFDQIKFKEHSSFYGVHSLPVTW
ncbi:MAG TPA: cytochrome P450 [Pseudonocardiaceae bacterium]